MSRVIQFSTFALLLSVVAVSAKPVIEFNTREFDAGAFAEGSKDKIEAVFIVKNTGEDTLKLTGVKPSCGCTVVKYDSLIAPGASTEIKSSVNIRGRGGMLSKSVTVVSNAPNDSIVRLTIKANIIEILSSSVSFIDMTGVNKKQKQSLQLTSKKKDLKIADVSFTSTPRSAADGKTEKPYTVKINFTLTATDTTRTDDMTTFRLELEPVTGAYLSDGDLVITTNNSDRKELRLRGRVDK